MPRREFTRRQRAEIILRATVDGILCCEGCGLVLGKKAFEIDHTCPEALADQSKPLTIEDGKLLGKACCHRNGKTQDDQRQIAKMKRQRDRNSGAMPKTRNPIKSRGFADTKKRPAIDKAAVDAVSVAPKHRKMFRRMENG